MHSPPSPIQVAGNMQVTVGWRGSTPQGLHHDAPREPAPSFRDWTACGGTALDPGSWLIDALKLARRSVPEAIWSLRRRTSSGWLEWSEEAGPPVLIGSFQSWPEPCWLEPKEAPNPSDLGLLWESVQGERWILTVHLGSQPLDRRWIASLLATIALAWSARRTDEANRTRSQFLPRLFRGGHALLRRGGLGWIAVLGLVAAIPWPLSISAPVRIEPATRRHVSAPFEGTFARSDVVPGQRVEAGEILGHLEGSELRIQRAAIEAEMDRVDKARDVHLAAGRTAHAQLERLEAERLRQERKLLEERLGQLTLRSPVAGIVLNRELRRLEGGRVTLGQNLFEIAPLDNFLTEIAISERDVNLVAAGASVRLWFDGAATTTFHTTLERIEPRAEVRQQATIFLASARLDDPTGELRPGIEGMAIITGRSLPLAWHVLRAPWGAIRPWLCW